MNFCYRPTHLQPVPDGSLYPRLPSQRSEDKSGRFNPDAFASEVVDHVVDLGHLPIHFIR